MPDEVALVEHCSPRMSALAMESVLIGGDLAKLPPADRVRYYQAVCESIGLNPLTKPFEYITLNGKLTLYAKRDCTDQLRRLQNVSIRIMSRELLEDTYVVTVRATAGAREDESIGAVGLSRLTGEARANALMKAETKAKRRVTLSICGLGWLDESEADTIPGASRMVVDDAGEIVGQDGGSRAAQAEVLKRKMAELAAPAEAVPESETLLVTTPCGEKVMMVMEAAPPKDSHALPFDVLKGFREVKKLLGTERYYTILGRAGFEKSNQIPDIETARTIYREMAAELKATRAKEGEGK